MRFASDFHAQGVAFFRQPLFDAHLVMKSLPIRRQRNLPAKALVHHASHLVLCVCVRKHPHELCHRAFARHILGLQDPELQRESPGFVNGRIAGLVSALRGQQHGDVLVHQLLNAFQQVAP